MTDKKAISTFEIAVAKGAKQGQDGGINGAEFERLGLPFLGGCCRCYVSIAAYNMYPTKYGYVMCRECVDPEEDGFSTVEEFDAWVNAQKEEN